MNLFPVIIPWIDLQQICHLQTSNKNTTLWSIANDYQFTQDFKHTILQGLQMNQMKRKEKEPQNSPLEQVDLVLHKYSTYQVTTT
jgi:hypothetical protein